MSGEFERPQRKTGNQGQKRKRQKARERKRDRKRERGRNKIERVEEREKEKHEGLFLVGLQEPASVWLGLRKV